MIKEYKINQEIRAKEVQLIDENGTRIGVVTIGKAVALSHEKQLDLVCINDKAVPLLCKLMDYKKYLYDSKKKEKENKKKQNEIEVSEIRLNFAIADHDLEVKAKKIIELTSKGNEVKINLIMKGREESKSDMAMSKVNKLIELCSESSSVKKEPYKDGKFIRTILMKKKEV